MDDCPGNTCQRPALAMDVEDLRAEVDRLRDGLGSLRAAIHACNRNPIPNARRIQWRDQIDSLLAG